jgi:phosphopantetheine adenylyltransferase
LPIIRSFYDTKREEVHQKLLELYQAEERSQMHLDLVLETKVSKALLLSKEAYGCGRRVKVQRRKNGLTRLKRYVVD